jgi:hypothetical protein
VQCFEQGPVPRARLPGWDLARRGGTEDSARRGRDCGPAAVGSHPGHCRTSRRTNGSLAGPGLPRPDHALAVAGRAPAATLPRGAQRSQAGDHPAGRLTFSTSRRGWVSFSYFAVAQASLDRALSPPLLTAVTT